LRGRAGVGVARIEETGLLRRFLYDNRGATPP